MNCNRNQCTDKKVFFPLRKYPTFSLTVKQTTSITTPMFTWCTPIHIKHIRTLTPHRAMFLYINNNIVYSSTQREDDRAVLYRRSYCLSRCPIISMLSIYYFFLSVTFRLLFSISLCVVGVMFLFFSVISGLWSSEMESVSGVRVSLLTADESKNTQIKTSVNCVKGRQTMVFIRKRSR